MTPWRIARGWSREEIAAALRAQADRPVSYAIDTLDASECPAWTVEHTREYVGQEPPGPPLPDGPFSRMRAGIAGYRFAHPRLTEGHFDAEAPLLGRDILVLIKPLFVRLLAGLRVGAVLDETNDEESRFGFRLDTVAGHIMHGSEWMVVVKDHRSGAITMQIDVQWRPARLPTWWMAVGFRLIGRELQGRWRRLAARRLAAIGRGA